MKNKIISSVAIFAVSLLIILQITFASWWNPFTWKSIKKSEVKTEQVITATSTPDNLIVHIEKATEVSKKELSKDCATIANKISKNNCYLELARLKKDPNICNMLSENTGRQSKNACLNSFPTYKPYKLVSGGVPIIIAGTDERISLNITATIKNENVLPFITKVAIQNCKVSDGINIINVGNDGGSYEFSKNALLPNQEAPVIFQVELSNSKKCNYNNTGVKICERPLEKVKNIISCDFSVATDDSQITGGWGEFWQTLIF